MDKPEILNAIEHAEQQSYGWMSGDLAQERAEAIDYFLARPFGNEIEGRSQVVISDVADTINGILPAMVKIFCGGDEVAKFSPRNGEDVQGAEQETEYVNVVVTQKNDWVRIFYVWAKDGLLQKNGYVKYYWEEREEVKKESYSNLSDDEFALIMQDKEVVEMFKSRRKRRKSEEE